MNDQKKVNKKEGNNHKDTFLKVNFVEKKIGDKSLLKTAAADHHPLLLQLDSLFNPSLTHTHLLLPPLCL